MGMWTCRFDSWTVPATPVADVSPSQCCGDQWNTYTLFPHAICQGVVKANQLHDVPASMREAPVVLHLHGGEQERLNNQTIHTFSNHLKHDAMETSKAKFGTDQCSMTGALVGDLDGRD